MGGVFLLLVVAAGVVVEYVVHHAEPIVRRRVIASLQQRFNSPVELDALHISVFKGLQVTGEGLRILRIAGPERPDAQEKSMGGAGGAAPMLSVKSFEFHAGVRELFEPTMRVAVVRVSGLDLNIPPKGERGQLLHHDTAKKQPKFSIVLDEIVVSNMTLTVETNKPGKMPLVFPIRNVTLHDVGRDKAFPFEAWLVNAKPVGDIHSTGRFGPWVDDEPRDTPMSGSYSFTHADLGPIKGVAGILSSTGSYDGTLGEIGVVGTTDTPDFSLDTAVHPVHLKTAFDATVDGTSGDTILNHVHATFLNTVLEASGKIVRAGGRHDTREGVTDVSGHFIDIAVTSDHARIEDILQLAAKTKPAVMRGAMTLRARLQIPPGKVSVSKKVRVQGTFAIRDAMFNNAEVAGYGGQVERASEWQVEGDGECSGGSRGFGDGWNVCVGGWGGCDSEAALPDAGGRGGPGREVQPGWEDDGLQWDGEDGGYGLADAEGVEEPCGEAVRSAAEERWCGAGGSDYGAWDGGCAEAGAGYGQAGRGDIFSTQEGACSRGPRLILPGRRKRLCWGGVDDGIESFAGQCRVDDGSAFVTGSDVGDCADRRHACGRRGAGGWAG